jgi:hypothetical protein
MTIRPAIRRPIAFTAAALLALALAAGACDDNDDKSDSSDSTTTTSTSESSTTSSGEPTIAASDTTASLDEAYGSGQSPVEAGSITAHWYQADGNFVVLYTGEGIGDLGPLCPGNSLGTQDGSSFDHVSNAETSSGGCEGVDVTGQGTVRVCDAGWIYETLIPIDGEGVLYASISAPNTSAGVLGLVETSADVPEIDPSAATYAVADGVLAGGTTELACT